ncbi:hypothetical protein REPUB_Repub01dG0176000 [Reevesia pubescens]
MLSRHSASKIEQLTSISKKSNSAMEIFMKVLTKIDVERRLLVSDGCLPALPKSQGCHGIVLPVKDDLGNLWNFNCIIRSGAIKKLDIVSGWIQFVRSKQLHSGDVVILYREDDTITGARYKIEVKRSDTLSSVNRKET